jgi:hypothetical protein
MELPSVASLEFEQIKNSIKTFLKNQSDFSDYDFEGSNLSMLVDVLAYNTMYTSYNINMAANELNLDTAVLRDNIVSHAKKLGYNPNSYTCAKVTVDITASNVGSLDYVRLNSGNILTTVINNKTYPFIIRDSITKPVTSGQTTVTFKNVELLQGTNYNISYVVDDSNENQRFFVPNNFVDSATIRVYVKNDSTSTSFEEYTRVYSIDELGPNDKIFFVEEIQDQKYEVIFGDGALGRKLINGEVVIIEYVITSGAVVNNIKNKTNFTPVYSLSGISGLSTSTIGIVNVDFTLVSEKTDGGSEFESIKSIKYRAPRYFASQHRAVTTLDYESQIQNIYPNAELVKVIGGESLTPPQYGKVIISIKPKIGGTISDFDKNKIKNQLKKYNIGSVIPEIIDAETLKVVMKYYISYTKSKTKKTPEELKSIIDSAILNYSNKSDVKNFGGSLISTEVTCDIKDLDSSIKNIIIKTYLKKTIPLYGNIEFKYNFNFNKQIKKNPTSQYSMVSSQFCIEESDAPVFIWVGADNCETEDNNIYISTIYGTVLGKVGTIDFGTGKGTFTLTACKDDNIDISVIPENPDVDAPSNEFIDIEYDGEIFEDTDTITADDEQLPTPEVEEPDTSTSTTTEETVPVPDISNYTPETTDKCLV